MRTIRFLPKIPPRAIIRASPPAREQNNRCEQEVHKYGNTRRSRRRFITTRTPIAISVTPTIAANATATQSKIPVLPSPLLAVIHAVTTR